MINPFSAVPTITCKELKEAQKTETPPIIIDVRELDEWNTGHLDSAVHAPLMSIKKEIEHVVPDKNKEIVLCCASGGRSRAAVKMLLQLGYKHVKNLQGGLCAYQQMGK
ncbi:MAG: rhodanese-like domain-containing protein [Candidatus Magasanikbacteria bacterium]|nr:rhodanese-like domain-containing protein [Candidatus Magasanikbacteria bacterium]MBT4071845.1 rhodanese-like domain-containing protein [Candidatus Magasanikbacteria bacterium]